MFAFKQPFQWFFRMQLRAQLMIAVTMMVVLAISVFAYLALIRQRATYAQEFKNATRATIEAARLGLEIGLKDENYEAINTVLRWVKENDNVEFIILTDDTGEIMASFPDSVSYTTAQLQAMPHEIDLSEALYLQEGKWILPTGEEGILFIGFSTAYLVKAERDTLINLVSIVAMVLVISIALAYYMAGQLTRPLEQLKATTQRIMANELTERAATDSGSMEMRTVADAFNQMIEKLLTSQRERLAEMELFNQSLGERNQVIEEINRKLIDSIEYAQLIQNALFPEPSTLDQSYMKVAPLFWPKDIVSGDFYWARQYKGVWYIAVVDCTGHGVPGAFMTLIGGNFLEQTLEKSESGNLSEILENMNARVRDFLKQHTNEYVTQDGMDMGLLRLDPLAKTLHFAGARRPLYVIRQDGQFEEHKAVRRSIGGKTRAGERDPYLSEAIPYEPGMRLFLSTDGFADQFNTAGQKFGSKRLKQFLQDSANQPLEYQIENLEALLFAHRGSEEQTDDITLVGVELL